MAEQAGAEATLDDDLDDEIEGQDVNDNPDAPEGDDEEVEVSFGDEAAPASGEGKDSTPIRTLRERNREQAAEIARLKTLVPVPKPPEVGEKPTLEACEWDGERFETELLAWNARKAEADKAQAKQDEESKAQREAWNEEIQRFSRGKTELGAKDFDVAEAEVQAAFSQVQLAALVVGTTDPAKLVYALGKHPEKLKALAAIQNPIKLAVAAAKLESTMKFAPRRRAPEPEGTVQGSAPLSQTVDKTEQRLEAEAMKSGDMTKLFAHRRAKRKAS